MNTAAFITEIACAVMMVNLRYFFMGTAISSKLHEVNGIKRLFVAFGTTDEIFSVSMLHDKNADFKYMEGLEIISFLGWVIGTGIGFIIGKFLPYALQLAAGITLYSMFVSLITQEIKKDFFNIIPVLTGAVLNCFLYYVINLSSSCSFIISMLTGTFIGALVKGDEK